MNETLDIVLGLWPISLAGIAIFSLCILIFVISTSLFYFRHRVKKRDYKIKEISFDHLDENILEDKEHEILNG